MLPISNMIKKWDDMVPDKEKDIFQIKKIVSGNSFPFSYQPELWEKFKSTTNCYAYALNALYPNRFPENELYYLGAFSGNEWRLPRKEDHPVDLLFEDLDVLGLNVRDSTLEESVPKNAYKICLLSRRVGLLGGNFHFFRQDVEGFWSHKYGWNTLPTNKYRGDTIITSPESAKMCYRILGYYIISHKLHGNAC